MITHELTFFARKKNNIPEVYFGVLLGREYVTELLVIFSRGSGGEGGVIVATI